MSACDCSAIAAVTTRALLLEVDTTPKPGLVDLWSNGSHEDLDPALFHASAYALAPYFRDFARLGASYEGTDLPLLFAEVRELGREAEESMFRATGGINTHKGALFSLGILDAAWGYAAAKGMRGEEAVLGCVSRMTRPALSRELSVLERRRPSSHGETVFRRYRSPGIRAEVMAGFPSARKYGIPALKRRGGWRDNHARLAALVSLMAHVEDSNVLHRGGREGLDYVRKTMRGLSREGRLEDSLASLDEAFIARNLSSGGAADLLSVSMVCSLL